jgi:hypothetical protein
MFVPRKTMELVRREFTYKEEYRVNAQSVIAPFDRCHTVLYTRTTFFISNGTETSNTN